MRDIRRINFRSVQWREHTCEPIGQ